MISSLEQLKMAVHQGQKHLHHIHLNPRRKQLDLNLLHSMALSRRSQNTIVNTVPFHKGNLRSCQKTPTLADTETDRDRPADITGRPTQRQPNRWTERLIEKLIASAQTDKQINRQSGKQTGRQTERQTDLHTDRCKDRQTETQQARGRTQKRRCLYRHCALDEIASVSGCYWQRRQGVRGSFSDERNLIGRHTFSGFYQRQSLMTASLSPGFESLGVYCSTGM